MEWMFQFWISTTQKVTRGLGERFVKQLLNTFVVSRDELRVMELTLCFQVLTAQSDSVEKYSKYKATVDLHNCENTFRRIIKIL